MNNTLCKDDLTFQEVLIKFFHFFDDVLDNPISLGDVVEHVPVDLPIAALMPSK